MGASGRRSGRCLGAAVVVQFNVTDELLRTASPLGVAIFVCIDKIREKLGEGWMMDRWKELEMKFITHIGFIFVRFVSYFSDRAEDGAFSRDDDVNLMYLWPRRQRQRT